MGKWETRLLNSSMLKPFMYLRYIDDIFGIWLYGEETLRDFHNLANSIHKQIQVDLRFSKTTVEFLDVRVSMSGGGLCTDVYAKPTDSKAYLHFTSDHPSYMKKAIPSGLAMRAKRICSSDSNFRLQTEDIHKNLSSRGYPDRLMDNGLKRVGEMDRNALLEGAMKKRDKQGVPMVITYSSHLPDIRKILKEKRRLLSRSENLRRAFREDPVFISYKRGTNLKDILVHKKTKQLGQKEKNGQGQGGCGKNCSVCRVIYKQR